MSDIIFLDAETKDGEYRLTSFTDSISQAVLDFMAWAKENGFKKSDIKFADVFEHISTGKAKHIAMLEINEDGSCECIPPETPVNPFDR